MKKRYPLMAASVLLVVAGVASAQQCKEVHWRKGMVIHINSAMHYGTRVQFPVDLTVPPKAANSALWDVDGAATSALIKPNSQEPQGEGTTVRAFTNDGNVYDIIATRSSPSNSEICVNISIDGAMFNKDDRQALFAVSGMTPENYTAQVSQLQSQLSQAGQAKDQAVAEALRRFRYHIYTRYDWSKGGGFGSSGLVSDVYDDGRFTYIRLRSPNRGLMSVETVVGKKTATVPTKYDDAYAMYVIDGIYPQFTLRMDDDKIKVKRDDAGGAGAF